MNLRKNLDTTQAKATATDTTADLPGNRIKATAHDILDRMDK